MTSLFLARGSAVLPLGTRLLVLGTLILATSLGAAREAQAKRVLVVGSHPDDEVLMASGRARTAFVAGDQITVVMVTNGDVEGVTEGLRRQGESVDAAMHVGLTENDVVFLGYPDGDVLTLFEAPTDATLVTSRAGQTATYGERGLGRTDYHRYVSGGVAGPYTRATVRADFDLLLKNFQPDEIYTHSDFESHGDHEGIALFLVEALTRLKRQGFPLRTKLYQSIVWMPEGQMDDEEILWPQLDLVGWSPTVPFLPDSSPCTAGRCLDGTPMEWKHAIHFAQPAEMLLTDPELNMKATAMPFLGPGWFGSFTRKDEFFWLKDFGTNMAVTASVTASSQDVTNALTSDKAVDGIIKGLELDGTRGHAWATAPGQAVGAWIRLTWAAPVRVSQVNLWNWDEPDVGGDLLGGRLLFSDGSEVTVGTLAGSKRLRPVPFAPKTVSWIELRVDQAKGPAVGLAEIEVLGAPASSTENVPPHFVEGPWPASRTISSSQTTNISVSAGDVDGDPLTYQWSAEGGTVTGSGANVLYTPPSVTNASTWFTVSVTVSDGRGGSATNLTYVEVTGRAADDLTVSPDEVFAGDPATGSIVLAAAAPAGGLVVPLTSSHPSLVTVPASVTVPAGQLVATFPVQTAPASATSTLVTITASFSGGSCSATLSVVPMSVASLSVEPASVVGGNGAQATVTLPARAGAAGALVQLASSAPAIASVPASVTIPAGASTATFSVSTVQVAGATTVTLSATWGTTVTTLLTVTPPGPFTLLTPANGAIVDTLTPTFTWQPWSGGGLSRYELRVDGVCVACAIPAASATVTLTTPLAAGAHSWTVSAIYGAANATVATGAPWTFTARECAPGSTGACPGNSTGACEPGTRTCSAAATWGACVGVVTAVPESCGNGIDDDCDGAVDCADPDCAAACGIGPERGVEPGPEPRAEPPRDAGTARVDVGSDGPARPGLDASSPDGAAVDGGGTPSDTPAMADAPGTVGLDGGSGLIDAMAGAGWDAKGDDTQVAAIVDGASDGAAPSGLPAEGCDCAVGDSQMRRSRLWPIVLVGLLALARRRRR